MRAYVFMCVCVCVYVYWAQYVTLKYLFAGYFVCIYCDRFYKMQKGEMDVVSDRITFYAME